MAYNVLSYSPGEFTEHKNINLSDAAKIEASVVWIDMLDTTEKEFEELKLAFNFHPLAIEDCIHGKQRAKVEEYGNHFFLVTRAVVYRKEIKSHQLSVFAGRNYLITVHKIDFGFLNEIKNMVREKNPRILEGGPDLLLYFILDKIVDDYFPVLDEIECGIEKVEREVVEKPTKQTLDAIFKLKKDLLMFRKPAAPMREVLHILQSGRLTENISEKNIPYYRDLYDHMIRAFELIETYRELASGAFDAYLSSVSNALNEVMKVLTALAAIIMVPALIAGIYGMNFEYLPEIHWRYGYFFALGLMAVSMAIMTIYFRRKRWM